MFLWYIYENYKIFKINLILLILGRDKLMNDVLNKIQSMKQQSSGVKILNFIASVVLNKYLKFNSNKLGNKCIGIIGQSGCK